MHLYLAQDWLRGLWDVKTKVVWQTEEQNRKTSAQVLINTLVMCVAGGLLIWSAHLLAGDFFENLQGGKTVLAVMLSVVNLFAFVFTNERFLMRKSRRYQLCGNAVLLLGVGLELLLCFGVSGKAVQQGTAELLYVFARNWNDYYDGGWGVLPGDPGASGLALNFWLIVLSAVVLAVAYSLRKRKWMLLLPGIFICMLLLVGLKPTWPGLLLFFADTVMVCCGDASKQLQIRTAILATLVSALSILSAWVFFGEEAEQVTTYYKKIIDIQEQLEASIKNFSWKNLFADIDRVDNHKPEFEEEEVLLLEMDTKPRGDIYLRGYHCLRYVGGTWKKDSGSYSKQCSKEGFSEEEGAAILLQQHYKGASASGGTVDYTINYSGLYNRHTYLPYGTLPADAEVKLSGDYNIAKARGLDSISVSGGFWPSNLTKAVDLQGLSQEEAAFFQWYSAFVKEQYLDVPESQQGVKELANQIASGNRETMNKLYKAEEAAKAEEINRIRIAVAENVQQKLESIATYSLELDALPFGTDAVEYFLSESKKGYCMHFASAGTMILRQLGIPARYVSGYVVEGSRAFQRTDGFFVTVKDSDAHAWVEVYLEDYGWIMVDMTPGFSQDFGVHIENLTTSPDSTAQTPEEASEEQMGEATSDSEHDSDSQPERAEESAEKKITTVEEAFEAMDSDRDGNLSDEEIADFMTKDHSILGDWEDAFNQSGRFDATPGSPSAETKGADDRQTESGTETEVSRNTGGANIGGADRNINVTVEMNQSQVQKLESVLELREALLAMKQQKELQRKLVPYLILGFILMVLAVVIIIVRRIVNRKRFVKERRIARCLAERHEAKGVQLINKEIFHYLCNRKHRRDKPVNDSDYLRALKETFSEITEEEWEDYFEIVQRAMYSTQEIAESEGALCHEIYRRIRQSRKA